MPLVPLSTGLLLPLVAPLQGEPPPGLAEEAEALWSHLAVRGDLVGRRDDWDVVDEDGDEIGDRMRVRQLDLDLAGPLTSWAEASLILSLRGDPVSDFETTIEEGVVRAPDLLAASPWGLLVQLGRFRSSFGGLNEVRVFDLPQPTRPLAQRHFLGERGFVQTGIAARLGLPLEGTDHELSLGVELLDNGDLPLAETDGDEAYAYVLDLDWRWSLSERVSVRAGASGYRGKQDGLRGERSTLVGVDVLVGRSADPATGTGALFAGGELYRARLERPFGTDDRPAGGFAWARAQVFGDWHAGVRFDAVEELEDERLETRRYGAFLHWLRWRRLRFAAGFEYTESDLERLDGGRTALVEIRFDAGREVPLPSWSGG